MTDFPLRVVKVTRDPDRTRIEIEDELMGRGVEFPSGTIVMEWRLDSYPPEDRLDHAHQSVYGSVDDLRQGTGGNVEIETVL